MSELQQLVCGKNHTDTVLKGGFKDICEMAIALKVTGKKYCKDTLNLYVARYLIGIKLCCSVQDN